MTKCKIFEEKFKMPHRLKNKYLGVQAYRELFIPWGKNQQTCWLKFDKNDN